MLTKIKANYYSQINPTKCTFSMRYIALCIATILPFFASSQILDISDLNLKEALVSDDCCSADGIVYADADTNDNLEIELSEALAVTHLNLRGKAIVNVEPLNSFQNLEYLNVESNSFVEIEITNKPFLEQVLLMRSNRQIEKIVITGNQKLEELVLSNSVGSLYALNNLTYLDCSDNALTSFELKGALIDADSVVTKVDCSNNNISNIEISSFYEIDSIDCSNNLIDKITDISLNNPEYFNFSNNQITEVSIYDVPTLINIIYENNPLEEMLIPFYSADLVFTNLPSLRSLSFNRPNIGSFLISSFSFTPPLKISITDLPLLEELSLRASNYPVDIKIDNLPLVSGQALTSFKITAENLNNINLGMSGSEVTLKNCDNITRIDRSAISSDKLTIQNLPNLEFIDLRIKGAESVFESLSLIELPKLDSLLLDENGNSEYISLNLRDLPSLSYLEFKDWMEIKSLQLSNLPSLETIRARAYFSVLDLFDLPSLQLVSIDVPELVEFRLNNLPALKSLEFSSERIKILNMVELDNMEFFHFDNNAAAYNIIDILEFNNLPSLAKIELYDSPADSLILSNLPSLREFKGRSNGSLSLSSTTSASEPIISSYIFEDLPALESIILQNLEADSVGFNNIPSIKSFLCDSNEGFKNLVIDNLNFEDIEIRSTRDLAYLQISNLPNIQTLFVSFRGRFAFENLKEIESFTLFGNNGLSNTQEYNSLHFSDYPNLDTLRLGFQLDAVELENLPNLRYLNLGGNYFKDLHISDLPSLNIFNCRLNNLDFNSCSFSNTPNLEVVDFWHSDRFKVLDLSDVPKLDSLNLDIGSNSTVNYLNLKNGREDIGFFYSNANVKNVCVDSPEEGENLLILSPEMDNAGLYFSDYCDFVPGGSFSTIQGNVYIDSGNGNCNKLLPQSNRVKLKLSSDFNNKIKFSDSDGAFKLESIEINTNLVLQPSSDINCYQFSPPLIDIEFDSLNQIISQDLCLIPSEEFNDLEVIVFPVEDVRPGFETIFKIQYSNKGSSTLSGQVLLEYENSKMNFLESNQTVNEQTDSSINWEFIDIEPFETRTIDLTMLLNSPMDIPALNDGDQLVFTSSISYDEVDKTPEDNISRSQLTVVNSYDPNDKTCMQGDTVLIQKIENFMHYLIRFENVGSADAINIVVKDVIDTSMFDISTLVPLNGSHSFYTQIRNTNDVEFIFEDINLGFEDDINDGFLNFKIKAKDDIQVDDILTNSADIFFDFNFPIFTNNTNTIIQSDADGDGSISTLDCDDDNPDVNPNQVEITYNGIDDDCDPSSLDDDLDQDGFSLADDCDDTNSDINPDQIEVPYNEIDDDCNPATLDDDLDQDGYLLIDDCDDNNPNINPDAMEIPNNEIDEDCDGSDLITSIHEIGSTKVKIYPNPASNMINIEVENQLNFRVTLFSLEGKPLKTTTNSNYLNIESMPPGTYFLEIKDKNSGQKIVERIVKQAYKN